MTLSMNASSVVALAGAQRAHILMTSRRRDGNDAGPAARAAPDAYFVLGGTVRELVEAVRQLAHGERQIDDGSTSQTPEANAISVRPDSGRLCGGLAPGALRRVRDYIEDRLAEKIELAALASIARLSECHFARAFKQSMGVPPHRYLLLRRIGAAALLIKDTGRSLTEISLDLGFSDQSHFTRTFARTVGETPRAFRNRHR